MKLKSLLLGLSAAALMGASAHAATTIYVTGSTAYRAPAIAAIINFLNNNTNGNVVKAAIKTNDTTATAADLFGASTGLYENSDASIIIETSFNGSAAGLVDLVTANTEKYIDPTQVTPTQLTITGLAGPNGGTGTQAYGAPYSSPATVLQTPLVSFSDTFYNSVAATVNNAIIHTGGITDANGTITKGPQFTAQINAGHLGHAGTSALAGAQDAVGIVPFAWYLGNSSNTTLQPLFQAAITNITQNTAASLIAGPTPIKLFSGSTSLTGNVFLVGRNEDSGTRVEAFAEAQKGFAPFPIQWELDFSSGATNNTGTLTLSADSGNTISEYNSYSPNFTTSLPTGGVKSGSDAVVLTAYQFEDDAALYTQSKIAWDTEGHSGYAGGSDVANVLLADNHNADTIASSFDGGGDSYTGDAVFVGYLGWADGYNLLNPTGYTSTAKQLNFNGVQPTVANVQNGSYTFWGFEHMYYMASGSTSNVLTGGTTQGTALYDINSIADSIFQTYAATNSVGATDATMAEAPTVAGILYNTVNVTRTQEGQPVKSK
jgi:hypothetical protein